MILPYGGKPVRGRPATKRTGRGMASADRERPTSTSQHLFRADGRNVLTGRGAAEIST